MDLKKRPEPTVATSYNNSIFLISPQILGTLLKLSVCLLSTDCLVSAEKLSRQDRGGSCEMQEVALPLANS